MPTSTGSPNSTTVTPSTRGFGPNLHWLLDMNRIDIDTDRLRTSVWKSGPEDGVPLLLIHGNLVTGRFWRDVATKLSERFSVAAPDLRGFGRTEAKPIDATRGL